MFVKHPFKAYYNQDSEILILGSLPSVKSRELNFYYMHPQNRFWKVLETVYKDQIGDSITAKKRFLKRHKIALWDVIKSCDINNSDDASIKNVKVNDIIGLIKKTNVKRIYTTGKKAYDLYTKYIYPETNIFAIYLMSPSGANCKYSFSEIVENYQVININKENNNNI